MSGQDGSRKGPLSGIRVLDVSNTFMVPYSTLLMAQMGAGVIKVEEPGGDILRQVGDVTSTGNGPIFLNANRGKKSVVLNLQDPADYERLTRLISAADVFVHNRPPSVAKRLRIDYASVSDLNPRLIHCSAVGYGSNGPYADLPAYDDTIQAASGLAYVQSNDGEPEYVRTAVADKVTALFILSGILAALYERERSGRGQAIECPMFECMVSFLLLEQQGGAVFEPQQGPTGYARLKSKHRRPYRTADGLLGVMLYTDRQWQSFFDLIGRSDLAQDRRFVTMTGRTVNTDVLYDLVERELTKRSSDAWLELFRTRRIAAAKVNSLGDLLLDPQVRATELFERFEHPVVGALRSAGLPVKFSRTDLAPLGAAPMLGEHNRLLETEAESVPRDIWQ